MVFKRRRPLATYILAYLKLISIFQTFNLKNLEHLIPVGRAFIHTLAPLQWLARTLKGTVNALATTLVEKLEPGCRTTLIQRNAQLPHLSIGLFLCLLNNNLCIVIVASAIRQYQTCILVCNNISKVWQGSLVVLYIDYFLQFKVGTGVAQVVLHPQLTIVVFCDCLVWLSGT